jgi:hypothetical protein
MHDHYEPSHALHPISIDLYKFSNHSHIDLIHESIIVYVFAGLVSLCLGIKCMQGVLYICCKVHETNHILTTHGDEVNSDEVNSDDVSELYETDDNYEPPEQLHTTIETNITYIQDNNVDTNKNIKAGIVEPIIKINEENNEENSEDLPSYYEVCVKPDK